nr:hypothetical protein [uncultured Pseudomonas sp.]
MIYVPGGKELLLSYHEISIRFRTTSPELIDQITAAVADLSDCSGCLSYTFTERHYRVCPWTIRGIWISDKAKKNHYSSRQLQSLLQLILTHDPTTVLFSEADLNCFSEHRPFSTLLAPIETRKRSVSRNPLVIQE